MKCNINMIKKNMYQILYNILNKYDTKKNDI